MASDPLFIGYPILCNAIDSCTSHRACREFRVTSKVIASKNPSRAEYARRRRAK